MIKETNFNPAPLIEHMKSVPYELVHTALYDGAALYDGFNPEKPDSEQDYYDRRVYQHYITTGKFPQKEEAMARTLHDHAIKHQLANFVKAHNYLNIPIYPLLKGLTEMGKYKNLSLTLTDDSAVIVQRLLDFQDKAKTDPEAFKVQGVHLS